jgi:hypothetical protein
MITLIACVVFLVIGFVVGFSVNTTKDDIKLKIENKILVNHIADCNKEISAWRKNAIEAQVKVRKTDLELVKMKRQMTRLATHKYEKTLYRLRKSEKENEKLRAINKLLQSGIALPELQIEDPFIPKSEENT